MEHSIREEQGVVVVAFSGDVDLESSPAARQVLLNTVGKSSAVIVDLSGVDYIDSSGIASLVEGFQASKSAGNDFSLASVSDSALRVLQLARLDKVFAIHASVADGLSDGG